MTVAQLIAALETMPKYMDVVIGDASYITKANVVYLDTLVHDVPEHLANEKVVLLN